MKITHVKYNEADASKNLKKCAANPNIIGEIRKWERFLNVLDVLEFYAFNPPQYT